MGARFVCGWAGGGDPRGKDWILVLGAALGLDGAFVG
jgi:hypothetical protein